MNATNPEFKVVGSNCLADFLGHANPENVAKLFEYLADAVQAGEESEGGFGGGSFTHFGLENYLGYVAAVIRVDGWMSRTNARKYNDAGGSTNATADTAWGVMMAVATGKTRDINPKYIPTKEDFARGTSCKEYMQVFMDGEMEKGELNDYLYNLNIVCRMGAIDFKTSGIAASIIATATREQGKEIERKKFSNLKETSKFFATEGDKVVVKATLMMSREIEGNYGCTTMMKFVSEAGNALTWFASGSFAEGTWVIGSEYILAGTVKKNEEYQGLKQTVLTRCNAVTQEWVDAEKAKAEKKAARAAKKAAKLAAVDSKTSP
jgi:transcriptional regulator of NAD metabolism